MADIVEKILNGRISLMYDSYGKWKATTKPLRKGEIALTTITGTKVENGIPVETHNLMLKAGDGTTLYTKLPWLSGLAADVYSWAKKDQTTFVNEFLAMTNGTETMQQLLDNVFVTEDELTTAIGKIQDTDTITTILAGNGIIVTVDASDAHKYTISHADTSNVANLTANGRQYVTGLTFDDFGHVTGVTTGTETVTDTNTAHTHTAGDGLKLTGSGGISGETKYELNIGVKLDNEQIIIYDKTNNNEIASMNASELVEDSYLSEVTVDDTTSTLEFTFILNDGTTKKVSVDLTHLVDTYTGASGDDINVTVTGYEIAAELTDTVKNQLNKADTAVQGITLGAEASNFMSVEYNTENNTPIVSIELTEDGSTALSRAMYSVQDIEVETSSQNYLSATPKEDSNGNTYYELDLTCRTIIDKAETALQNIKVNDGLKVTTNNTTATISIVGKDEADADGNKVIFVLDCGSATDLY